MNCELKIENNRLVFSTTSFKAEKGSVLHSGIYNRELASSLAAGAAMTIAGFFFAARYKITALHFLLALVLFAALFLVFRTYIFREPLLCVTIDKDRGDINLSLDRMFGKKNISFELAGLKDIRQGHVSIAPENPDGIRLVEKVALQHGTVIPGFGKTAEFYTVEMEFKDGRRIMIFSSPEPSAVNDIAIKIKNFIER
jgi:hypothetical protein